MDFLQKRLANRQQDGNLRALPGSSNMVDFVSNDYLGLARDRELANRIYAKAGKNLINGATGSRLLSGNHEYYSSLEQKLSHIFQAEASLVFNSGYHANQAVISSVPEKGDMILYDQLSHVCLKEGAWLSKAETNAFRHNDLEDLEMKLKSFAGRKFVVTESIFSMDGDLAPLAEMIALCEQYHAYLIVDEAHSTGAYGKKGSGLTAQLAPSPFLLARIYTFGKAMGVHGACVVGQQTLINFLINFGRSFIYTTALPPHSVLSIAESFQFLEEHIHLQDLLRDRIQLFTTHFHPALSSTAIQPVIVGSNEKAKEISLALQKLGFDVRPILSPTVQRGKERLRISLHVHNTREEIVELSNQLMELL